MHKMQEHTIHIAWDTVLVAGESRNTVEAAAIVTIFIDGEEKYLESP